MEADEPIVPWWLGIVFGLIAWVPWTGVGFLLGLGAGFHHVGGTELQLTMLFLPSAVIVLLLGIMGLPVRLRTPALSLALLLTVGWFGCAAVIATTV